MKPSTISEWLSGKEPIPPSRIEHLALLVMKLTEEDKPGQLRDTYTMGETFSPWDDAQEQLREIKERIYDLERTLDHLKSEAKRREASPNLKTTSVSTAVLKTGVASVLNETQGRVPSPGVGGTTGKASPPKFGSEEHRGRRPAPQAQVPTAPKDEGE